MKHPACFLSEPDPFTLKAATWTGNYVPYSAAISRPNTLAQPRTTKPYSAMTPTEVMTEPQTRPNKESGVEAELHHSSAMTALLTSCAEQEKES